MASTYSTNLKVELIGTGEQAGTWGATTNVNLGTALEQAIVGKADVSMSSTTVTLTLTNSNAAQDARAIYLNLTGSPGGAAVLEVPAIEKPYIVKNGSDQQVTVKVSGQTGVAIPTSKTMWLYNDGTDVTNAITNLASGTTIGGVAIGTSSGSVTSVDVSGGTTGLTTSGGPVTSSGTITLAGTLAVANGGTGVTSSTGTGSVVLSSSPTLVTPALGTPSSGTLTNATGLPLTTGVTGTLPVANGGTGATTLTSNNVILGNGTSAVQFVAPSTSGNVLTSNGTTWVSSTPAGGGGGKVIQSLTFTKSASQTFSTTSEVSITGWSSTPTITISSASNRARATLYIPFLIEADVYGAIDTLSAEIKIKSGGTEYALAVPLISASSTFLDAISMTQTLVAELPAGAGAKAFDVTITNGTTDHATIVNNLGEPTYLILEEIAP